MQINPNLPKITKAELLKAIRDGVAEGLRGCIMNATDCPTMDILNEIKSGVKEAMADALEAEREHGARLTGQGQR